jgi:hypothetical protein
MGEAKSSLGDAESSLGDAESSLGDAKSSLGDAKSSLVDVPAASRSRVRASTWSCLTVAGGTRLGLWTRPPAQTPLLARGTLHNVVPLPAAVEGRGFSQGDEGRW